MFYNNHKKIKLLINFLLYHQKNFFTLQNSIIFWISFVLYFIDNFIIKKFIFKLKIHNFFYARYSKKLLNIFEGLGRKKFYSFFKITRKKYDNFSSFSGVFQNL
ncbi:Hypothetical Protein SLY_0681 [Strawberry lethal yellows phytoplasma (CPA) str. NZSb11]|uniref:Uncharacterized protein n=1 Tax=Strawberry lethal yellows phytoplasma (CPA) str. NZSb11 TaxID=980422 RepID=R4RQ24_PHYAS|nr:Hypothetical Protein SLY_0681 [Strawberry lethal yellows phytoplasma (CPA) str. NZSb11]